MTPSKLTTDRPAAAAPLGRQQRSHGIPAVPAEAFTRHARAIAILLAGHHLRRLNHLYQAFQGDLLLPILTEEIGVHYLRCTIASAEAGQQGAPAAAFAYPRPLLTQATGLARETVRRGIMRLIQRGWIEPLPPAALALTPQALDYFSPAHNRAMIDDFLWTGDRIGEVLRYKDDPQRRAALRDDLAAALATRTEDHLVPIFSTQFEPPHSASQNFGAQPLAVSLLLAEYWLSHLYRLQELFDGDLVLPLLLGEVAHYNVAALAYRRHVGLATLDAVFQEPHASYSLLSGLLRPCNAHSLSMVTGVPDSSVRRKLAVLVQLGWLAVTPTGAYVVAERTSHDFERFNETGLRHFVETDRRLRQLLKARAAAAGRATSRA